MNLAEAKANIGKPVMSRDAGFKLIRSVATPHGPYLLQQVTKSGMAIIQKPTGPYQVAPALLSLPNPSTPAPPSSF
jgi:hypothetical protein